PDELAILPKPEIIEELDFEAILKRMLDKLRANYQNSGLAYTVERLRYDPQIIQLETASYSEMLLRQRINEAVRSQMLPFAYGGDLDILAAFYDVNRMFTESDERLRTRIVLAIQGRSTG
ncbi:baseplate assembly protein, partial [Ochrobactrum sp. SFR4]|nr:baseplate assembly protein [Ochrobactrum sp. SFR4]